MGRPPGHDGQGVGVKDGVGSGVGVEVSVGAGVGVFFAAAFLSAEACAGWLKKMSAPTLAKSRRRLRAKKSVRRAE